MYFCYVDETGMDEDTDVIVTAGIVIDAASRLVKATREWTEMLESLLASVGGGGMSELKTSRLYEGLGKWRSLPGNRHEEIDGLVSWFCEGRYKLAIGAVDKTQDIPPELVGMTSHELLAAFHVALQLQKDLQAKRRNKGVTFLVMDQSKIEGKLVDLISDPPSWSDGYYGRGKKAAPFGILIHTPFYVKSEHIALVQLADLIAYIYRKFVDVQRGGEGFTGEMDWLQKWKGQLDGCLLPRSARYPTVRARKEAKLIQSMAPQELVS